jgi:hypothetical protein
MSLKREDCHWYILTTLMLLAGVIAIKDDIIDVLMLTFANQVYIFTSFCMFIKDLSKLSKFNYFELIISNVLYILFICIKSYMILVQTASIPEALILVANVVVLSLVYKTIYDIKKKGW